MAVRVTIAVAAVSFAVLAGGIVMAAVESSLSDGMRYILANRWGTATVLDVYAGAVVVAAWIRACEQKTWVWLVWVLALVCLGHLVSLTFLLMRTARSRTLEDVFRPSSPMRRTKGPGTACPR